MNLEQSPKTWKEWERYIKSLLERSDEAVKRAIIAIWERQEPDEQKSCLSVHRNGIGFSKLDALKMSEMAETILQGFPLSQSELNLARQVMKKYWRQLAEIAKGNLTKETRKGSKTMDSTSLMVMMDQDAAYVPTYSHATDAGMDLRAVGRYYISPGESAMVRTGCHVQIPTGYFGIKAPRSGLGSKGITMRNAAGIIDSGYRGEILCALWNTTHRDVCIEAGDRICQLIIMPYIHCEIKATDQLSESDRGTNGYGSTGIK